jgi:hypothetical protein
LSPSDLTNQATREEWQELGFFYERETNPVSWRIIGSREGLSNFPHLLDLYAQDPRNQTLSEHSHYGPYMYLKVETAELPEIDERSIRGSISDLLRLRDLVAGHLSLGMWRGARETAPVFVLGAEIGVFRGR